MLFFLPYLIVKHRPCLCCRETLAAVHCHRHHRGSSRGRSHTHPLLMHPASHPSPPCWGILLAAGAAIVRPFSSRIFLPRFAKLLVLLTLMLLVVVVLLLLLLLILLVLLIEMVDG